YTSSTATQPSVVAGAVRCASPAEDRAPRAPVARNAMRRTKSWRSRTRQRKGRGLRPALPDNVVRPASGEREVRRRFTAVAAGFDVEGDLLAVLQFADTRALDSGDVDEHVLLAAIGSDE